MGWLRDLLGLGRREHGTPRRVVVDIDARYDDQGWVEAEEILEAQRSGRRMAEYPRIHKLKRIPGDTLGREPRSYDGQVSKRWVLERRRKGDDVEIVPEDW